MEPSKKAVSAVELNFPRTEIGDRYELSKIIGKGSYGFVAEAKIKGTDVKVFLFCDSVGGNQKNHSSLRRRSGCQENPPLDCDSEESEPSQLGQDH